MPLYYYKSSNDMSSVMPSSATADFMGIPPELRGMIYDYVFMDPLNKVPDVEILSINVPYSSNLRRVNKFVFNESAQFYEKAATIYHEKRMQLKQKVLKKWDDEESEHGQPKPGLTDAGTERFRLKNVECKHACIQNNKECYMCNDPEHRRCFQCGRNVVVALYCETFNVPAPYCVVYETAGRELTELGQLFWSLSNLDYRSIRNGTISYDYIYGWWQGQIRLQKAIDVRCAMRKKAIEAFWQIPQSEGRIYSEPELRRLEMQDKRWHFVERVRKTIADGDLGWRSFYTWRAQRDYMAARAKGIVMKPDFLPPMFPPKKRIVAPATYG